MRHGLAWSMHVFDWGVGVVLLAVQFSDPNAGRIPVPDTVHESRCDSLQGSQKEILLPIPKDS